MKHMKTPRAPDNAGGYSDGNVFYSPEKWGLKTVGSLNNGGGFDFDYFSVWIDASGFLYAAEDSGCSCPYPFENVTTIEQLTRYSNASDLEVAMVAWKETDYRANGVMRGEIDALVSKAKAMQREAREA